MTSILCKYEKFVKEQIAHNENSARKNIQRNDEKRSASYKARSDTFRDLLADLASLEHLPNNTLQIQQTPKQVSEADLRLTADELKGLPDELINELSISDSDRREFLISQIIDEQGGIASIDKILIGIYQATNEIEKRNKVVSRLYRMAQKGLVFQVPDKKGIYSTTPGITLKTDIDLQGQIDDEDRDPD